MKRLLATLVSLTLGAALVPQAFAQEGETFTNGTTYATVSGTEVVVGNALVERRWQRDGFQTLSIIDKRSPGGIAAAAGPDFRLTTGAADVPSTAFDVAGATVNQIAGGVRATLELVAPGLEADRVIEVYEGIAGFRTQTILRPIAPLALGGYTIDEAAVGDQAAPTIHAFRAGADWREPGWGGAQLAVGDKHAGTWRDTRSAGPGQALQGAAQWVSTVKGEHSLFMVMERNDWPSSRAGYNGSVASLEVDYSRELVMFGPFEEDVHAENPTASPGRYRVLKPTIPFPLEAAFTGFGIGPDDEPWQFHKYLSERRLDPYDHAVTFNSNGTDDNVRSTGAKDDMVEEVIEEVAPKAKALGIETFILDDGWQARSGDWEPDCGDTPGEPNTDPRWDGSEESKFRPRYSDCTFERVRELIAPMELGLWMTPMHFHPRSQAYMTHPQWACKPVGDGVGALSIVDPNSGSNDAGLGTWSTHPELIAHVESRIQDAIDNWGVTYFKFDFLVWLDCVGQGDLYDYKEAFIAMLDRVIANNPGVTFQIDETNDYRLFPFESVTRAPSWFQNGSPTPDRLLHNIWNLSPYIPAFSLGQHFLGGSQYEKYPVDTLMAVALPSHLTFFSDLRKLPDAVIARARPWIDFYKANREHFTQMTYPLLDDPMDGGWTALQLSNPEEAFGALLAFRQGSEDATKTIALRNVPAGMTFELFEGPSGNQVGTVTSEQLSNGIDITLPEKDSARVLLIKPAQQEFDPATALTYDGDTQVRIGQIVTLAATLTGSDGPIENAPLTFTFRGESFQAITGPDGRAAVTGLRQSGPPGTYEVVVRFAGSDRYRPSGTSAVIRVGGGPSNPRT